MSDGFFAEYAIVDARLCAKLSDKMTFQQVNTLSIYEERTWLISRRHRSLAPVRPSMGLSRLPISSKGISLVSAD
jgi:NADPH:quinone reductase-like Zn-dependent oxidoreductase